MSIEPPADHAPYEIVSYGAAGQAGGAGGAAEIKSASQ